jgi:hypothetical protein
MHSIKPGGDDNSKLLTFEWEAPTSGVEASSGAVELRITLSLAPRFGLSYFKTSASLLAMIDGDAREATVDLPEVEDTLQADALLASQVYSVLGDLALQVGQAKLGTKEG